MSSTGQAPTMELPKRWPLVVQASNRGESPLTDARLINCFAEVDPNTQEFQVQKRIGYTLAYNTSGSITRGAGVYNWGPIAGAAKNLYSVFTSGLGGAVYKDGIFVTAGLNPTQLGQKYFFVETQGTVNRYLVMAGPADVFYTSGGAFSTAVLPVHQGIVGLAYLDGTIYFMDQLCNIYGSGIDDPTTWSALNVVTANSVGGDGVGFVQLLQYVIALKSNSMEPFADNANPTGSPLSPVASGLSNYGCVDGGSVQVIDNILFYLSSNKTVSPQLVRVDGLTVTVISTPPIERLVDAAQQLGNAGNIFSWVFKHGGHRFYGCTVRTLNLTLVYDIDQNLWYQWTDTSFAPGATNQSSIFPLIAMGYTPVFLHAAQGFNDGNIYTFEGDYSIPTDNGVVAPVDIYTANEDFGTYRSKTLHRMYIRSDQKQGSLLYVNHSDDDYQTWSVPRKLNLGIKTPFLDGEGSFVKRAYHFRHASPTAFRIRSADLQMDIGTI